MDPATLQIVVGFAIIGFVLWLLYLLLMLIFRVEIALRDIVADDYYPWWIRVIAWVFWAPLAVFTVMFMILGVIAWAHNIKRASKWFRD